MRVILPVDPFDSFYSIVTFKVVCFLLDHDHFLFLFHGFINFIVLLFSFLLDCIFLLYLHMVHFYLDIFSILGFLLEDCFLFNNFMLFFDFLNSETFFGLLFGVKVLIFLFLYKCIILNLYLFQLLLFLSSSDSRFLLCLFTFPLKFHSSLLGMFFTFFEF